MSQFDDHKTRILDRLEELGVRMQSIESELDTPKPKDLNDQAIDLEDDEVLEGVGLVAQREVGLLRAALDRIEAGTYGVCRNCDSAISPARLEAVPYAIVCKTCAAEAAK